MLYEQGLKLHRVKLSCILSVDKDLKYIYIFSIITLLSMSVVSPVLPAGLTENSTRTGGASIQSQGYVELMTSSQSQHSRVELAAKRRNVELIVMHLGA